MSAESPAWCARCGHELQRAHGTAYVRCQRTIYCGKDYWLAEIPWPMDRMEQRTTPLRGSFLPAHLYLAP